VKKIPLPYDISKTIDPHNIGKNTKHKWVNKHPKNSKKGMLINNILLIIVQ
jgi:hypothetical protein